MRFSLFDSSKTDEVVALFTSVFSASEGADEGLLIGQLASDLITNTQPDDLIGCVAIENDRVVGCIFFSRFAVPSGEVAFILSPVAVLTNVQASGIGQRLIRYGLDHLKSLNIDLVFTYGNPKYYCKTGFKQISEDVVKAPYPLSQPIGWLAQSLDGKTIPVMEGGTQCVEALSNPNYW